MSTENTNKLRQLICVELQRNHWGNPEKYGEALASVIKKHPSLACSKVEVANEFQSLPSPRAFRSEVEREQKARGCTYDEAFATIVEKYPAMKHFQLANEDLTESGEAGRKFQELIDQYFKDFPHLDRTKKSDYDRAYNRVCQLHPELVSNWHQPGRGAVNLWRETPTDGHTPARKKQVAPSERAYGEGAPPMRAGL